VNIVKPHHTFKIVFKAQKTADNQNDI